MTGTENSPVDVEPWKTVTAEDWSFGHPFAKRLKFKQQKLLSYFGTLITFQTTKTEEEEKLWYFVIDNDKEDILFVCPNDIFTEKLDFISVNDDGHGQYSPGTSYIDICLKEIELRTSLNPICG